jgi:hypothetical protein
MSYEKYNNLDSLSNLKVTLATSGFAVVVGFARQETEAFERSLRNMVNLLSSQGPLKREELEVLYNVAGDTRGVPVNSMGPPQPSIPNSKQSRKMMQKRDEHLEKLARLNSQEIQEHNRMVEQKKKEKAVDKAMRRTGCP